MIKKNFCKKLDEALMDEHKAPIDYSKLKKLAPTSKEKKIINGISSQEKNHFKKLNSMKQKFCS